MRNAIVLQEVPYLLETVSMSIYANKPTNEDDSNRECIIVTANHQKKTWLQAGKYRSISYHLWLQLEKWFSK